MIPRSLLSLVLLASLPAPWLAAQSDEPIVGRPAPRLARHLRPVAFGDLQVRVAIDGGVATTELRQTLHNRTGAQQEADWMLPLPKGAVADKFTMTVNGQTLEGEVLDAGSARRTYEAIVRQRRDPGLLEYAGSGCLRARVFPIPAQGKVDVLVRFTQIVPRRGTLSTWSFPVRGAVLAQAFEGRLSLQAKIHSGLNLHNVYSPLPGVDIVREGDHDARLSMELAPGQIPERDLEVVYGVSENAFGLDLLTHRDGGDGFFMMMLDPKRDWPDAKPAQRSMTFVLDTSGSMAGEKMTQAAGALRQFLASLDEHEFFNVVPFSTTARPFFPSPVVASKDNVQKALAELETLEAKGGTNIEEAMTFALEHAWPPADSYGEGVQLLPLTVFLTDGLPSVGETDIDLLTKSLLGANKAESRLFVFGVGDDVNTRLLDTLAKENRGANDYVRPGENIEVAAEALFTKIAGPVMTDVALSCEGIESFDVFPRRAPDLFMGGQLIFVGRYKAPGHHAIRLRGTVGGVVREYVYERTFPETHTEQAFVQTLWAQRKLAMLLEALQKNRGDQELLAEVKRLGAEFGVVTPYTSHLILEEADRIALQRGVRGREVMFGLDDDAFEVLDEVRRRGGSPLPNAAGPAGSGPATPAADPRAIVTRLRTAAEKAREPVVADAEVGTAAVDRSVMLSGLADARQLDQGGRGVASIAQQRVGERTFYLVQGVWVQREYDKALAETTETIEAFSSEWFELSRKHPELAKVLAFSTRIVVVLGEGDARRAIEVVPPPAEKPQQAPPAAPAQGGDGR